MTMVKVNNRPTLHSFNGLVNELFNGFENSINHWGSVGEGKLPPVNILENEEGYHAELLAPGRKKELFSIGLEKGQLTIAYHEEKPEGTPGQKQIRKEFSLGNFKRVFNIDESIDAEKIQARYEDGLLKVFLPKKAQQKPSTLTVEVQ